jgi:hypothetical protein
MPMFASMLISIILMATAACADDLDKPGEIETDRPDVTPYVVPNGSIQLESGIAWTDDEISRALDLTESLLRIGLTNNTEMRINIPTYFGSLSNSTLPSGFNDLAIGIVAPMASELVNSLLTSIITIP